jgi:hypothetical protein
MELDEATGNREIHARNAREPVPPALLRSCSALRLGRVSSLAMHPERSGARCGRGPSPALIDWASWLSLPPRQR